MGHQLDVNSPTTSTTEPESIDQPMTTSSGGNSGTSTNERSLDSVDINNNPSTPSENVNNNSSSNSNSGNGVVPMETTTSTAEPEAEPESVPLEPEFTQAEIKEITNRIQRSSMVVGERWALLNAKWYQKWAQGFYSRDDLGRFDNSELLQPNGEILRSGIMENNHYILIPEAVYTKMKASYPGGPDIYRKVIIGNFGSTQVDLKVPIPLQFAKSSEPNKIIDGYALKSESISSVKERMCKVFDLVPNEVKIWDFYKGSKHAELKNLEYVSNSNLLENQLVLLEEKNADGTWPADARQSSYSSYYSSAMRQGGARPGITGLSNLGNTCFMNSALQCLSNTYPLTKYFVNNKYEVDLNKDNPLGCHGDLATEYANLIKQIWLGTYNSVAPRSVKDQVEKFAPQFAGYHQHDSQELLAFLLDGLHEDLNKVLKKPFVESKDYDGRPDAVIAKEQWEMHKARNNSVIVDWFQSQLKSKLVCPDCGKISITFDPFMYLSLPLQSNSKKQLSILLMRTDGTSSTHDVVVQPTTMQEAMQLFSEEVKIPQDNLIFTIVLNNAITKVLKPDHAIDVIGPRELVVAFEIKTSDPNDPNITYQQVKISMKPSGNHYHPIRYPFILSVPSTVESIEELYQCILDRLGRTLRNTDEIERVRNENQEAYENQKRQREEEERERNAPMDGQPGTADEEGGYSHNIHNHRGNHGMGYPPYHGSYPSAGGREYNMSFGGSYYSSSAISRLPQDPRFVFQIIDISPKKSPSTVSFPLQATEILLLWEENYERYLDTECYTPFTKNPHHRDIPSEQELTLEKCIQGFITEEKLGPQDPWYCNVCKDHKCATKKFDIWSAPPILVVHLKRFSYRRTFRDKLDLVVNFPLENLDLSDYVLNKDQPPPIYDLYAVSNHFGSLGGGHYTAFAHNEPENKWYRFDDASVSETSPNNVVSEAAYVLFYRRKDTFDPNFHLNTHLEVQTQQAENESSENNNTNTTSTTSTTTTSTTTNNTTNENDTTPNGISSTNNNNTTVTPMEVVRTEPHQESMEDVN